MYFDFFEIFHSTDRNDHSFDFEGKKWIGIEIMLLVWFRFLTMDFIGILFQTHFATHTINWAHNNRYAADDDDINLVNWRQKIVMIVYCDECDSFCRCGLWRLGNVVTAFIVIIQIVICENGNVISKEWIWRNIFGLTLHCKCKIVAVAVVAFTLFVLFSCAKWFIYRYYCHLVLLYLFVIRTKSIIVRLIISDAHVRAFI